MVSGGSFVGRYEDIRATTPGEPEGAQVDVARLIDFDVRVTEDYQLGTRSFFDSFRCGVELSDDQVPVAVLVSQDIVSQVRASEHGQKGATA